jgi:plastocyanin
VTSAPVTRRIAVRLVARGGRASRTCAALALAAVAAGCAFGPTVGQASGPPAATVRLVAEDNRFAPARLALPADAVVALALENRDPGILHNVAISAAAGGEPRFRGETFTGIATVTYLIAPLPPGTYRVVCEVHPTMEATLELERAGTRPAARLGRVRGG